ncbi:MAG: PD-(D/E)XK nuclease domain-containing protein [Simkaniaceae bacterium]|nr:PD-(D/E)XK nuclease domain-containing protein [Simkaniaceae bacterium]
MLSDISNLEQIDLSALIFQTGYLTISGYDSLTNRYQLDFPNQEVTESFLETLVNHFAAIDPTLSTECQETLENQNLNAFFDQIKITLSSFPYQLFIKAKESTYQGILLGILKGMGFGVYGEKLTNLGRIDLVIEMPETTYILELKPDSSAEVALNQILEKKYHEQFLQKGKEIALVGVNFSSKSRNIENWKASLYTSFGELLRKIP